MTAGQPGGLSTVPAEPAPTAASITTTTRPRQPSTARAPSTTNPDAAPLAASSAATTAQRSSSARLPVRTFPLLTIPNNSFLALRSVLVAGSSIGAVVLLPVPTRRVSLSPGGTLRRRRSRHIVRTTHSGYPFPKEEGWVEVPIGRPHGDARRGEEGYDALG